MYRLRNTLPFLVARLGVRMGALFGQRIAGYGLTVPMYRVLAALSEQTDQQLNELSAMTTVELSTMSRLVGTMVERGLVSRTRLASNERTVSIQITTAGADLFRIVRKEAQHYEQVAVSTLEPAEVEHVKDILIRMYDALDVLEDELIASQQPARPKRK